MRFKPGQQVVCIHDNGGLWTYPKLNIKVIGPKINEIVTVKEYSNQCPGNIAFVEYTEPMPDGARKVFPDYRFEPLMDISELTEILQQQTVEV